jgi:methanogenic corrinoid protein MtbC1
MQTAQAINALRHQEQTGRLVIPGVEQRAERLTVIGSSQTREGLSFTRAHAEGLYESLLRRDTPRADEILNEALAMISPEGVILGVISPVLNWIGEGWERGELSISTEHFATNYLRQRLLMWMLNSPPAVKMAPIILACAPEEWHEGSLLVMGALLRRRRWPVAYLGQSVPLADLATFVRDIKPSIIVLVAMTESSAAALQDWPRWMPEVLERGRPVLGYGGRVFVEQPEWQSKLPGIYLGSTFEEGIESIERILQEGK